MSQDTATTELEEIKNRRHYNGIARLDQLTDVPAECRCTWTSTNTRTGWTLQAVHTACPIHGWILTKSLVDNDFICPRCKCEEDYPIPYELGMCIDCDIDKRHEQHEIEPGPACPHCTRGCDQ